MLKYSLFAVFRVGPKYARNDSQLSEKKKKKTGPVMTNALVLTKENNWLQRDKPRQD